MIARTAFALLNRLFPSEEASAHCDIPCGIYDPHLAQVAALTVIRMNQLIEALEPLAMEKAARDKNMHQLSRYTATKERHAELVKHEVRIIRGDFFKPENSPDNIGEIVDAIKKTAANKLLDLVNQFAEAFWKAKNVATKKVSSNQAAGGEYVVPAA